MKNILIVEDEKALSRVLRDELLREDFKVDVANDGEEAMQKLIEFPPDLVLLDLLLPKKSGFDVLEEMKQEENLRSIPVIVLSNLGQDTDIKRAIDLGAVDYFVKSQHPLKEIVKKVKQFIIQGASGAPLL